MTPIGWAPPRSNPRVASVPVEPGKPLTREEYRNLLGATLAKTLRGEPPEELAHLRREVLRWEGVELPDDPEAAATVLLSTDLMANQLGQTDWPQTPRRQRLPMEETVASVWDLLNEILPAGS
jgi:hypothetical protein